MLNDKELAYLKAICAMSHHHGSFQYLCECIDGWTVLTHKPIGTVLYTFAPTP